MNYPINKLINFAVVTDKMNNLEYDGRGQTNKMRRMQQNFGGKCAELFINNWFGMGQDGYILEILPQGRLRSDIKWSGKGWGIKSQDEDSVKQNGKNRYVFHSGDLFKSDIYCGVLINFEMSIENMLEFSKNQFIYKDNYERFAGWANLLTDIKCEWGFCSKRESLIQIIDVGNDKVVEFKEGLWDEAGYGLKKKKVLKAYDIPVEERIDKLDNFPKNKSKNS